METWLQVGNSRIKEALKHCFFYKKVENKLAQKVQKIVWA